MVTQFEILLGDEKIQFTYFEEDEIKYLIVGYCSKTVIFDVAKNEFVRPSLPTADVDIGEDNLEDYNTAVDNLVFCSSDNWLHVNMKQNKIDYDNMEWYKTYKEGKEYDTLINTIVLPLLENPRRLRI